MSKKVEIEIVRHKIVFVVDYFLNLVASFLIFALIFSLFILFVEEVI